MTVQNTIAKNVYAGNGSTTVWPYTFALSPEDGGHVQVIVADALDVETMVPANEFRVDTDDQTVTYPLTGDPLPAGHRIALKRVLPKVQELNLENQGPFFADDIETSLDRIVMLIQQISEETERAVKVGETSPETADQLLQHIYDRVGVAEEAAAGAAESAANAKESETAVKQAEQNAVESANSASTSAANSANSASEAAQTVNSAIDTITDRVLAGVETKWATEAEATTCERTDVSMSPALTRVAVLALLALNPIVKSVNTIGPDENGNVDLNSARGSKTFTQGTYTFTVPSYAKYVRITAAAGGGGGGGVTECDRYPGGTTGGSGGSGARVNNRKISVTPNDTYTIIVGAGGAGGPVLYSGVANGGGGGSTSFGKLLVLSGGGGGSQCGPQYDGGSGGSSSPQESCCAGYGAGGSGGYHTSGLSGVNKAGSAGTSGIMTVSWNVLDN